MHKPGEEDSRQQIDNTDDPLLDERYNEETAAEIIEPEVKEPEEERDENIQNVYGWIAIALSAISFFFIPILFAGAGIILGFIARNRDANILGNTAITIGIISLLVRLLIIPLI